jgi:hypothetical protein
MFTHANWATIGGGYSNYNIIGKTMDGFNIWIEHENIQIFYSQTNGNNFNRDSAYRYLLRPEVTTIKPNTTNGMSRNLGISYRFYKEKAFNIIVGAGIQSNQTFKFTDTPTRYMEYENDYKPYLNIGTSIDISNTITLSLQDMISSKSNVISVGLGYIFFY